MQPPALGLYICYWSLMDPLCQTQSLAYLLQLAAQGDRFVLLTFEQPRFRLPARQLDEMRRDLARKGIYWYPLAYHKRHPLIATSFDCLAGVVVGAYAALRHRPTVVHSRGSIPAAMALALHWICGLKFLYDADSRLSLEYVENGHWSRDGMSFKITSRAEDLARRSADAVVVLTERLREDFMDQFEVRAPIEVVPCCVDTSLFRYDAGARAQRRGELGLNQERLFIYVGKLGARYLVPEIFGFLKCAREAGEDVRLLILSGDAADGFHAVAESQGIDRGSYAVRQSSRTDVPSWLSAADAGLAFIRTAECERGSSPIKVGEYLAIGLPVVCTSQIGDVEAILTDRRAELGGPVGVVLTDRGEPAYRSALVHLFDLLKDPRTSTRCRSAAERYLDLVSVGGPRYRKVYDDLRHVDDRRRAATKPPPS
jgi:glycosyltransferase involved in cell wall biosynthesis